MTDNTLRQLYIDGTFRPGGGGTADVFNPATGKTIAQYAIADTGDLSDTLTAATRGFTIWRDTPAIERSRLMQRAARYLRDRIDDIAHAITLEQGKPLAEAKGEANFAIEVLEWYAEEARRTYGTVIPSRSRKRRFSQLWEPVGVVAGFASWNFPATNAMRKIAGALGAGCSIILKPSEETPLTALIIAQAFDDAGLSSGVLNIVYGNPEEISQTLLASSAVKAVSLTGSGRVGHILLEEGAAGFKRSTMELGGHAPVIVTERADLDRAVADLCAAKFRNAGQTCVSPSRFLIQRGIYDDFVTRFTEKAAAITVGDGMDEGTGMGPVFNATRLTAIKGLVEDARAYGAEVQCGGERISNVGNYYAPTVLTGTPIMAEVMNEEPFGPLAMLNPFDTLEDALYEANRLNFGLAGYIYTGESAERHMLVDRLDAGLAIVNDTVASLAETPFGGVNESGFGLEGGREGLREFMRSKFISEG